MSDTPETDNLARGNHVLPTDFARDFERERDQWRECAGGLVYAIATGGHNDREAALKDFFRLEGLAK
jgi:hypothetical protein